VGMGAIKVRLEVCGVKSRLTLVVASLAVVGSMRSVWPSSMVIVMVSSVGSAWQRWD